MPLDTGTLATLEELLQPEAPAAELGSRFRQRLPGLCVTRCDESDLGVETPFRSFPAFHLFLVNGNGHCWSFTDDPARATSVLVAKRRRAS